jgi:hypothetical protein
MRLILKIWIAQRQLARDQIKNAINTLPNQFQRQIALENLLIIDTQFNDFHF